MPNTFPRINLPEADVAPDSLIQHISNPNAHPNYIDTKDNDLGIRFVTLYKSYTAFRTIPTKVGDFYNPGFVIYGGPDAVDPITGVVYELNHPYVYTGEDITISGKAYPIWKDCISNWYTSVDDTVKKYIYMHATDDNGITTNNHPNLARKAHTHGTEDIIAFAQYARLANDGLYPYICANEYDIQRVVNLEKDGVTILYVGAAPYTDEYNNYFKRGRMYTYDKPNRMWTDTTFEVDAYTKNQTNVMIQQHNENKDPFKHDLLAPAEHRHFTSDIDGFISAVDSSVSASLLDNIGTYINTHNNNNTAHPDLRQLIANLNNNKANSSHTHSTDDIDGLGNIIYTSAQAYISEHNETDDAHPDIRRSIGNTVSEHNVDSEAHSDIREVLSGVSSRYGITSDIVNVTSEAVSTHHADGVIHITSDERESWNAKAAASDIQAHTEDSVIHITSSEREAWNGKADGVHTHASIDVLDFSSAVVDIIDEHGGGGGGGDVEAHNSATTAHPYIQSQISTVASSTASEYISTHNADSTAHPYIQNQITVVASDVASEFISLHKEDHDPHPWVTDHFASDLSSHNTDSTAHEFIRGLVASHVTDTSAHLTDSARSNFISSYIVNHSMTIGLIVLRYASEAASDVMSRYILSKLNSQSIESVTDQVIDVVSGGRIYQIDNPVMGLVVSAIDNTDLTSSIITFPLYGSEEQGATHEITFPDEVGIIGTSDTSSDGYYRAEIQYNQARVEPVNYKLVESKTGVWTNSQSGMILAELSVSDGNYINVYARGIAVNAALSGNASMTIYSGGVGYNVLAVENTGMITVSSGGRIANPVVYQKLNVISGIATGVDIGDGGKVAIGWDSILEGATVSHGGMLYAQTANQADSSHGAYLSRVTVTDGGAVWPGNNTPLVDCSAEAGALIDLGANAKWVCGASTNIAASSFRNGCMTGTGNVLSFFNSGAINSAAPIIFGPDFVIEDGVGKNMVFEPVGGMHTGLFKNDITISNAVLKSGTILGISSGYGYDITVEPGATLYCYNYTNMSTIILSSGATLNVSISGHPIDVVSMAGAIVGGAGASNIVYRH